MPNRKSWYQHWMEAAEHAAQMSTCAAGRKVGAVFVRDNRLLSTGFNGVPAKFPHPKECKRRLAGIPSGEKLEMCGCAHAEANGIANAAREGISLKDSTLYCTTEPCGMCSGALANVGVRIVVYRDEYRHEIGEEICDYAQITRIKYEGLPSE
jgi:dCMP deaminase